jgi:hypothetical protein
MNHHHVVELEVDELEECLIMRCSTFQGASHICDILNDHFPYAVFDVLTDRPAIHLKDYDPERYAEIRDLIPPPKGKSRPNLIVVDGGKE